MTTLEPSSAGLGAANEPRAVRVIVPRAPGARARLREFWQSRRLIPYFGVRFIRKMYMRTWLGRLWIPLRPVLDVGSRALIFGGLLGAPSQGIPYFLFFLVGMTVWRLLASTLYWVTRSVELNRRFLKRIYVPRLTLIVGSVWPAGLWFLMYAALAVITFAFFAIHDGTLYLELSPAILVAIAGLVLVVAIALAIGMFTSVYGAQARDVRFGLAYVVNFWFFFTPVIYPLSAIPAEYQTLAQCNPMTAPVEMVRYGVFGIGSVPALGLAVTIGTILVIGALGTRFFVRSESAALDSL